MKKTGIQLYGKKQAYKHAYKCMKKKGIQMYDKKTHKKHAYKCMTKTGIQTRIKMYDKNILIYWSCGQPITAPREHGGTALFSRAPQP